MNQVEQFLRALFEYKQPDHRILIWLNPGKKSYTFDSLDEAIEFASMNHSRKNIYIGCGLGATVLPADKRYQHLQVVATPGLWLDLDFGADHKNKKIPQSQHEALELLQCIPQRPSIILHTGNGFHCWWLWKEPWVFESNDEREAAHQLGVRLQAAIKLAAKGRGWTVDSTADLPRVLRVAGTLNWKSDPPKPVTFFEFEPDRRFVPDDFEDIPVVNLERNPSHDVPPRGISINEGDALPEDLFLALLDADPRIRQTWDRKRRDMADQSPSSYHLALANYAVMAGWNDKDITLLLARWSRARGEMKSLEKVLDTRPRVGDLTYAQATIAKARAKDEDNQEQIDFEQALAVLGTEDSTPEAAQVVRDHVSMCLGVTVARMDGWIADPPTFDLILLQGGEERRVPLGDGSVLFSVNKMQQRIFAYTRPAHLIPKLSAKDWEPIKLALVKLTDHHEVSEESTNVGQIAVWLEEYLAAHKALPETPENMEIAATQRAPWISEAGDTYIHADGLHDYVRFARHVNNLTIKELHGLLHLAGCRQARRNVIIGGRRTTLRCWELPRTAPTGTAS